MNTRTSFKKDWVLTEEALNKLLLTLGPDREIAARKYESIRSKLITFFECRRCCQAEDYADITINRVARRLIEGKEVYTPDPSSFFFGVAYKVLQEYWDGSAKVPVSLSDMPVVHSAAVSMAAASEQDQEQLRMERYLECLEQCLQELPSESRELIIEYYEGEAGVKIENRKRLAERLGIQLNALRIRAQRIREKLEHCMSGCLQS